MALYCNGKEIELQSSSVVGADTIIASKESYSGTRWSQISGDFKSGIYNVSLDSITSSDTDSDVCRLYFGGEDPNKPHIDLPRENNVKVQLLVLDDYDSVYIMGSDSYINADGDTLEYKNLVISREPDANKKHYPYWGKRFGLIGDSFSQGSTWMRTMTEILGAKFVINKAKGGAKFAYNSDIPSAYEQAQQIISENPELDYIYVVLGTNDQGNSVEIGEFVQSNSIDDFDITTYCGGMQACINALQNAYPDAVIRIGFTPNGSEFASGDIEPYLTAMKMIAQHYSVQYIDSMSCGFSPYCESYASYWETGVATRGYHPSQKGYVRIGTSMARKALHGN